MSSETIPPDAIKQQLTAAKLSIYGSIALLLISAIVGIIVDSITLILDASASLIILAVALLTHFSIKKIHLPPDDAYNFGYNKYEPFTVSLQGGLIIATCVISVKFAIQDMIHAEDIKNYVLPVIATFCSGLIGIFIWGYLRTTARRANSSILKASAFHWFSDTLMSFGIFTGFLLGLILQRMGYHKITPYLDPIMTFILALFLIQTPVKSVMKNVLELLDAVPAIDVRNKVRKVVELYKPRSFGVHRLRTRKAGDKIFVDVCFVVKENLTVKEIQGLADSFERDLKADFANYDVIVYFKPA